MKINRNNYEAFFLDFYEGALDDKSREELMLFLEKHPDLKNEFEEFELIVLPPVNEKFSGKADLKQGNINIYSAEDYFISAHEGLLNENGKAELASFLSKQLSLQKEYDLYGKVYLEKEAVEFPWKESLRRGAPVRRVPLYYAVAAAASAALLVGFFFFQQEKVSGGLALQSVSGPQGRSLKNFAFKENTSGTDGDKVSRPFNYIKGTPLTKLRMPVINSDDLVLVGFGEPSFNGIDTQLVVTSVSVPVQEIMNSNAEGRDYLTVGEWVSGKVKEKIYEDENERTPGKLNWLDAVAFIGKGVSKLTGKEIKVKSQYDEKGQLLTYEITAGKLAFAHDNQKP